MGGGAIHSVIVSFARFTGAALIICVGKKTRNGGGPKDEIFFLFGIINYFGCPTVLSLFFVFHYGNVLLF